MISLMRDEYLINGLVLMSSLITTYADLSF